MLIPKSFFLGGSQWHVKLRESLSQSALGRVHYYFQTITLATHRLGTRRRQRELAQSFWHEATHAILHDMRHALRDDEKFVEDFARRLTEITDSARL
jgi:hypothetical protein